MWLVDTSSLLCDHQTYETDHNNNQNKREIMAVTIIRTKNRFLVSNDSEKRIITGIKEEKRFIVTMITKAKFPTIITNEEQ